MVTTELEKNVTVEWLKLARERVQFPGEVIKTDYQKDVDMLVVKFSDQPSVKGNMDYESGAVYNYDRSGKVVSIEILDFYGIFADA